MNSTPTDGNFTNNLTMTQADSSALPSWLTYDASTSNITATNPDTLGNTTYTITNTYTGSFNETFTLTTNLIISVIDPTAVTNSTNNSTTNSNTTNTNKNDDSHCLNASSEAICGVLVTAIFLGVLGTIAIVAVTIYCKCKGKSSSRDIEKVNGDEAEAIEQEYQNEIEDEAPETEAQGMRRVYQTEDNRV